MIPIAALLSLAAAYAAFMARIGVGLRRSLRSTPDPRSKPRPVAVIVAAHNESESIEACVESILANDYPARLTEIIVVDDGSTDGTARLAQTAFDGVDGYRALSVLRLSGSAAGGKQAALKAALGVAKGEIILTTDADCTVSPRWISSMVAQFSDTTGFVSGPVRYDEDSTFLRAMEALEFVSLVGFGAGSIGIGYPTICNGANAAYRKDLADEFRALHAGMATAQDELLMLYVHHTTSYDVRFCPQRSATVMTRGARSLTDFLRQRARWASIVPHFPDYRLTVGLTLVFTFFVAIAGAFVAGFMSTPMLAAASAAILVKTAADMSIVVPTCRHFGCIHLLKHVLSAEMLQIPYILIAAPFGLLNPPQWKARSNHVAALSVTPRYSAAVVTDDS